MKIRPVAVGVLLLLSAAAGCARRPQTPDVGENRPGEPIPGVARDMDEEYVDTPGAHSERPGKHSSTTGRHGTTGEPGGGTDTQSGAEVESTR
jgi:hypothetical protein